MRLCLYCLTKGNEVEVPIGNVDGPFCDGTHKWMYNRRKEKGGNSDVTDKPPTPEHPSVAAFWNRNNGVNAGSPKGRR